MRRDTSSAAMVAATSATSRAAGALRISETAALTALPLHEDLDEAGPVAVGVVEAQVRAPVRALRESLRTGSTPVARRGGVAAAMNLSVTSCGAGVTRTPA